MGTDRSAIRGVVAVSVLLFASPGQASEADEMPNPGRRPVPIQMTWLNSRIGPALLTAKRKLGSEPCRQIFAEFRDLSGQPLQRRLDELGQDAASHFDRLVFFDGRQSGMCRRRDILAVSSPGSRVVYVCGQKFADLARSYPGFAAAILIHEQLHALGLGENPPSSQEITLRVLKRCGS